MLIGYARTSTADQIAGFEAQQRELKDHGCEKVFAEQVSSVKQRDQLEAAIDFAREGDTLVVTKLDRLARSVPDLIDIRKRLSDKGVGLHIMNMPMMNDSATAQMLETILGAVAQFEREVMLERQREGIAKAKADGKFKGRPPMKGEKAEAIRAAFQRGDKPTQIAKDFKVSRATVYRLAKDAA
ncbi:recombinase family protein [Ruegeria atlantica]|uniref:Recombinase family protein n=1 Tax=Ruegeria atlantica TaxID=81569 RepID=A0AA90YQQ1_9RHOB|nr:recombinase family protein [Ruegeria atlantica]NOE17108.1 recombinase family protein [Ruegeria atlantica]